MKQLIVSLTLITLVISFQASFSQNYKKLKVPTVEVNGDIKDAAGNVVGNIDIEGKIKDPSGTLIAYIDAFGSTIDAKSEEKICKTDKDGNMLAVVDKKVTSWKTNFPEPGMELCLIKDFKGNIVASTHKRYKQFGSSALYFYFGMLKAAAAAPNTGSTNAGISNQEAAKKSLETSKTESKSGGTTTQEATNTSNETKPTSTKKAGTKKSVKADAKKTVKKDAKKTAKKPAKKASKKASKKKDSGKKKK